jgi:hypothetical protein
MRLPEVEEQDAQITVPRHFPPQSSQATVPLGNDEAVLLTMPTPEGTGRVIVVMVRVQQMR